MGLLTCQTALVTSAAINGGYVAQLRHDRVPDSFELGLAHKIIRHQAG
jgi:hypothetical protein